MCGIAGGFGLNFINKSTEVNVLNRMRRRGPDGNGIFREVINGKFLTLFHSRLAIIDLNKNANQPFVRKHIVLIFNGEIYNYIEIANELKKRGYKFTTNSDTEVIVNAYLEWGLEALSKLEGMWALALLDKKAGKIIISRDRFGEKPLFYLQQNNMFYFASEPKIISALINQPLKPNLKKVKQFLSNGFRSLFKDNDTYYENLYEVKPSHNLIVDVKGKVSQNEYWSLKHNPNNSMSEDDVLEGVKEHLFQSMKLRLRADVPIAFCLSGGIDSSSLTSIASKIHKVDVQTFSIIDKDERYNELDNIKSTLDDLRCKSFFSYVSNNDFFDNMRNIISYHDAPISTISYYVHNSLSKKISELGFKVAISGTGADEIFSGYYDHYNFWLSDYVNSNDYNGLINEWSKTYGKWVNNSYLKNPESCIIANNYKNHLYQNRDYFNSFLIEPNPIDFEEQIYTNNLLRNRMMNELKNEVVPVILRSDDMNSMMYSIENRSPFLDTKLVNFASQIPNKFLIQNGYPKWPLRESMKGIITDKVRLDSRKKGFNASILSLVNLSDKNTIAELTNNSPIFDIIKKDKIIKLLEKDLHDNSLSKFLFSFISTKLFLEQHA